LIDTLFELDYEDSLKLHYEFEFNLNLKNRKSIKKQQPKKLQYRPPKPHELLKKENNEFSFRHLNQISLNELKSKCKSNSLKVTGKKDDLIQRLVDNQEKQKQQVKEQKEEEQKEEEQKEEEQKEENLNKKYNRNWKTNSQSKEFLNIIKFPLTGKRKRKENNFNDFLNKFKF